MPTMKDAATLAAAEAAITHEPTRFRNVFKDVATGKYVYSDETQCLSDRQYESAELAHQGCLDYSAFSLDGPVLLKEIETLLDTVPGLDVYTCVHIAKKAFAECRGEDAILALRQDLDKLHMHSRRLYELVLNEAPHP